MSKIIKIIDEREMQNQTNKQKRGTEAIVKWWEICSSILMTAIFTNIARTTASTSKFIY